MTKLIVYTCVTGNYDTPKRPSTLPIWAEWRSFTERDFQDNRYPKLQPHKVFPEYEYSLWLDGNIDIVSPAFWDSVEQLISDGVLYAGLAHPSRDDVYEESLRILKNDREKARNLRRTVKFLCKENFPRHYGMNENAVILRKHNDPQIISFDDLWWQLFNRYTRRDQMTWSYCMWKCGLSSINLIPKGSNVRTHPWFCYTPHGPIYKKNLWQDALRKFRVWKYSLWLNSRVSTSTGSR